jgi:HAD-superfamily hydrolase, subfamily IIB
MIKLLASDFDGTLLQNAKISTEDLESINSFRSKGNLFGIITGRSISMIKTDLEEYNVPFDFLVCNNGGILCDEKLNIIKRHDLSVEVVNKFMERFGNQTKIVFGMSDGDAFANIVRAKVQTSKTFIPPKNVKNVPYEEILATKKVNSMLIREKTEAMTMQLQDDLLREFEGEISLHFNNGTLDINSFDASKKKALYELGEYFQTTAIYVVGDGYNDLEMIEEFQGFALDNAVAVVKEKARATVASVAACIALIEMEK